MDLPETWTGSSGHVLHEPWIPAFWRDDLAMLIAELEASGAPGCADKRRHFRTEGHLGKVYAAASPSSRVLLHEGAVTQLLNQRIELLVGAQLARAGVLTAMRKDTPDFEGRWGTHEFGVEVTTRARHEIAEALHEVLERALWDGPDVQVTLTRSGAPLFSKRPDEIAAAGGRLAEDLTERLASGADLQQPIPVPELRLVAAVRPDAGSSPGQRVVFESLRGGEESDYHWQMAARMIQNRIEEKAHKRYSLPSVLVLDVSRLGSAGRMPTGLRSLADLFSDEPIEPWTTEFQSVLDNCELGDLLGVLIVRSNLRSQVIEPLCWRGEVSPATSAAVAAVLFGDQMPVGSMPS